jgi:hypothetical protein
VSACCPTLIPPLLPPLVVVGPWGSGMRGVVALLLQRLGSAACAVRAVTTRQRPEGLVLDGAWWWSTKRRGGQRRCALQVSSQWMCSAFCGWLWPSIGIGLHAQHDEVH